MTKQDSLGITTFDAAKYLKDEESIAAFLNASIEMNDPAVLMNAVSTVARARSMTQLAEASGLGRESLYKALKAGATPRFDTVMKLLGALGLEIFIAPAKMAAQAKPAYQFMAPAAKKAPAAAAKKAAAPVKKPAPAAKKHVRRAPADMRAVAAAGQKSSRKSAPKRRT